MDWDMVWAAAAAYEAYALHQHKPTITQGVGRLGTWLPGKLLLGAMWAYATVHFYRAVARNQKRLLNE